MATALVVDCDMQNASALDSPLGYSGHRMVEAASGREAPLLERSAPLVAGAGAFLQ